MSDKGDMAWERKLRAFPEAILGKLLGSRAGVCIQVEALITIAEI